MHAYPAPRFNPGAIEPISAIRGRATPPGTPSPAAAARLETQERVTRSIQRDNDIGSLNLYQNPAASRGASPTAVFTGGNLDLLA